MVVVRSSVQVTRAHSGVKAGDLKDGRVKDTLKSSACQTQEPRCMVDVRGGADGSGSCDYAARTALNDVGVSCKNAAIDVRLHTEWLWTNSMISAQSQQDASPDIPERVSVTLVSSIGTTITASWPRPNFAFDRYMVDVTENDVDSDGSLVGQCAFSNNAVHSNIFMCGNLRGCRNVSLHIRTYSESPPEQFLVAGIEGIFVPGLGSPEVSNLKVENISATSFVVTWERPKESVEYYTVEVADHGSGLIGDTLYSIVSCNNGAAINPWQTSVTCTKSDTCTSISVRVKTHSRGPPERESRGVALENVLLPGTGSPEVSNLKVENISATSFVVTWERPKQSVEYYTVEVADHGGRLIGNTLYSIVTCNNGAAINPGQTSVTCTKSDTCTSISVRVKTHTRGPPERESRGVALENVLLPGTELPEVTDLKLVAFKNDSFTVTFRAPDNCVDTFHYNITDHNFHRRNVEHRRCTQRSTANNIFKMTCVGVEACQKVDFAVVSHKKGPAMQDSPGVALRGIDILGKCSPEVSNLKVENISATSFVVTWERPKQSVEYYTVEVADHGSGLIGDTLYSIVSCKSGAAINPWQTSMTCTKSDTCTSISVRVKTHTRGPPERESRGVALENVLLPGTELPEVTDLKLVAVKNDSFTVTFRVPENCVDTFHYNITDHNFPRRQVEHRECTRRSTANNIFEVTCVDVEACHKVDFAVSSSKKGPPMQDSPGVALRGIDILGKCSPEVSNLKVENISVTSFVVTWERPKESIEYYTVEVTDHGSGLIGDTLYSIVSCNNGAAINPWQTSVTCTKSDTCTSISVRVKTHTGGPPERESRGVALENVLLPGTGICHLCS
ncbi:hypothetical protein MTO96_045624 [Rhipicephalus appendiculatus]